MSEVKIVETGPYFIKSTDFYILCRDLNTLSSQLLGDCPYNEITPVESFTDGFKHLFDVVFQHYEDSMFFSVPIRYKLQENSKIYLVSYFTLKDSGHIVFSDLFLPDENESISSKTIEVNHLDRICFDALDKSLYFICDT